jgi:hypothetical protein
VLALIRPACYGLYMKITRHLSQRSRDDAEHHRDEGQFPDEVVRRLRSSRREQIERAAHQLPRMVHRVNARSQRRSRDRKWAACTGHHRVPRLRAPPRRTERIRRRCRGRAASGMVASSPHGLASHQASGRLEGEPPKGWYGEQVLGKILRRVVPFLFVCQVLSYLDRVNAGFAALTMNRDGLTRRLSASVRAYSFSAISSPGSHVTSS